MPLSIVDDTRCVVVDIVPELLGRVPISSIPSGRAAAPRDLLQSRRRPQTSDRSASPVCYVVSAGPVAALADKTRATRDILDVLRVRVERVAREKTRIGCRARGG